MTIMTSREFNQDIARAKREATLAPVIITDRGRPSHVLMSMEEYEKLQPRQKSVAEIFAIKDGADIDFEPPRLDDYGFKPVEFD